MMSTPILNQEIGETFAAYHGDCVDVVRGLPDNSIDYIIFSPPFASLYTYSASERDMGNCKDVSEFAEHYRYLSVELMRALKPGRLMSVHCMNLPATKQTHGYIGIQDFRGDLIRLHQDDGFIYHSEVCIWKDPVTAMQRTKALGLLHKQVLKDKAMVRQGIPDYLVTFRKPGKNENAIEGPFTYFVGEDGPIENEQTIYSIDVWQRYASPVWMDVNPTRTLQTASAKEHPDEKHICPLQLDVIDRALQLWTNPGDTVLSPFGGIGSEGYEAIKMGRRTVLAELKESYYRQMVANLKRAEIEAAMPQLDLALEPA
jgi:DNA modification methylase